MVTKSLAAVVLEQGAPVVVQPVDVAGPARGEALVRITATGVCHSDHNIYSGYRRTDALPAILGHEGAGVIEQVGDGVTGFAPGDHVVFAIRPMCGRCKYCATGRWNLCQPVPALPERDHYWINGEVVHGGIATYSQYAVVNEMNLVAVDPSVDLTRAALVGCAVITGVGAVVNRAKVPAGATVAVWGCGGVGLNVIQGAALVGASRIIAVDVNASKFQYAETMGATDTVDASRVDAVDAIVDMTDGGVDYAFEVIGQPATLRQALEATCDGGTAVLVGAAPDDGEVSVPMRHLFLDRALIGCSAGTGSPRHDFQWLLSLYQQGRLKLDELITKVRPLAEVNEAFADMEAGAVARTVLLP